MYTLIDIVVGNDPSNVWPGNPDATTGFPKSIELNYFRIYSNDPALPAAVPQPGYTAPVLPAGLRVVSAPTTGPLPTAWTIGAIGTPTLSGSSTWNPTTGEWIVKSAGDSTQGEFAGTSIAANGQIIAKLDSVSVIGSQQLWAGVAMRTLRSSSSPEISLVYYVPAGGQSTGRRIVLQSRQGARTVELASVPITPSAVTLRLVRQGDVFIGSYSTDGGSSWRAVGQTTSTALPGSVLAGLIVTSDTPYRLSRAIFSQAAVTAN